MRCRLCADEAPAGRSGWAAGRACSCRTLDRSALQSPQMRVEPAGSLQQLRVRTHLDDPPVDHADDAMTAAHRGQTMGDDDDGSVLDDPAHVALDQTLAVIIERRSRFVEYQNPR